MSNLTTFTNKHNLKLLWEVLLDELNINKTNTKLIANIRTVFESNINPFSLRANPKLTIMELNKQFLSQVVLAVNRLFPNFTNYNESKQEQNFKRIIISDEEVSDFKEPYKIEDIHASRQSEFEKEVERKRMEMDNYMTPQKPTELDFSDKNLDGKITAMDSLVADKMAQRNLEIELFQNKNYNNLSINPEQWLTPKETSVKNDKNTVEQYPTKNNQSSKIKHISFDSNNNVTLSIDENEQKIKKVSWDDLGEQTDTSISIFNKLKKQPTVIQPNEIINGSSDETTNKQYIEQKSLPLPQVKREEIQRNQAILQTSNANNEPIIPKTEIIRQLNEMNNKIDNLYELVFKLVSNIKTNEGKYEEKNKLDIKQLDTKGLETNEFETNEFETNEFEI